jgi:hypothetical protein
MFALVGLYGHRDQHLKISLAPTCSKNFCQSAYPFTTLLCILSKLCILWFHQTTGRYRAPIWCGVWLVEARPWQGNKNYCCNAPKKIYLIKICGIYIEPGALGTIDNQIVRKWARVFSSTYDRVIGHFKTTHRQ